MLSAILFALLVAKYLIFGAKPRDPLDFRDPWSVAGVLMVTGGVALRSWAAGILRKESQLTMTGPYGLIRNPLYVGSLLMLLGFCALIDNPANVLFILGPLVLIYALKVRQEERVLAELFPHQWPAYASSTPRFLPRFNRARLKSDWRLSRWIGSREYRALSAAAAALAGIKIWQMML